MNKDSLIDACVTKGLNKIGSKAELRARLREPIKVALTPEVAVVLPVLPATQVSHPKRLLMHRLKRLMQQQNFQ